MVVQSRGGPKGAWSLRTSSDAFGAPSDLVSVLPAQLAQFRILAGSRVPAPVVGWQRTVPQTRANAELVEKGLEICVT